MKKLNENTAAGFTLCIIALTFVIRLIIAANTGLGIGESYYFRGAMNLNLSYFDQPPLFFWLSGLNIKLFGLTTLGLRLPAVILFAGTSWLLFTITKRLFNAEAGFWAVLMLNLSAVFTVPVATWFQPDAPLMFFWLLSAYFFVQILLPKEGAAPKTNKEIYLLWVLTGVSMGLATLSKYHVVFLFAGVFIFAMTHKDQRHWLRHPGPYLAMLLTLIIAFPVLWWNYENHWVSFVFQGSRAGTGEKFTLHPEWFTRSVLGQSAWLLPWIWVPIIGQLIKSFRERKTSQAYSFIFWTSVLPIVFFTVVTLWADLQYHFHWQAPGYLMLFMPLGYSIQQNLANPTKARGTRRWVRFSAFFTVITIAFLTTQMATGFWHPYGPKWIVNKLHAGIDDPTMEGNDYLDIKARFVKEGWMKNPKVFAACTRWWLSGKIDWALKGEKPIVCFNGDPRNMAFLVDPKKLIGYDAVVISQNDSTSIIDDVTPYFESIHRIPDIVVTRGGRPELYLIAYYCKGLKVPKNPRPDMPVYYQLIGLPPFGN